MKFTLSDYKERGIYDITVELAEGDTKTMVLLMNLCKAAGADVLPLVDAAECYGKYLFTIFDKAACMDPENLLLILSALVTKVLTKDDLNKIFEADWGGPIKPMVDMRYVSAKMHEYAETVMMDVIKKHYEAIQAQKDPNSLESIFKRTWGGQ